MPVAGHLKGTKLCTQFDVNTFMILLIIYLIAKYHAFHSIQSIPTPPWTTFWGDIDMFWLKFINQPPQLLSASKSGQITIGFGKTVSTQTPASNGIGQRAVFTSIYFQQVTGLGRSDWHALSYDLVRNMNCRFQRMGDTGVMFGSMLVWLKTCTC